MSLKLNMSKFKKIGGDKHSTTMRHADGHEIKIAHSAVSPKMRAELNALPMEKGVQNLDEGGTAKKKSAYVDTTTSGDPLYNWIKNKVAPSPSPDADKTKMADGGQVPEPNKKNAEEVQKGATSSGYNPDQWAKNIKEGLGLAEGGIASDVEEREQQDVVERANRRKQASEDFQANDKKENENASEAMMNYAQGGDVEAGPGEESMGREPMEQTSTDDSSQVAAQPQQPTVVINTGAPAAAAPQMPQPPAQQQAQAPQQPIAVPELSAEAQNRAPAGGLDQPSQSMAQPQQPDPFGTEAYNKAYMGGLNEQKSGILGEANAMSQQGAAQAKMLQAQQQAQAQAVQQYKDHYTAMENERQALIKDIQDKHIDPKNYWNDHSKVATGIGIILAGFNPTSRPNAALEFLNHQMNLNLEAQKADLGKKENLLSANLRQFGNMRDATDMTRMMQADIISNQLKQAAAQAMDPLAKARALQEAGKLDQQSAAIQSQTAMRRSLVGSIQNGSVSPERVVNMIVPEHQRAEANKELSQAQGMVKSKDNLLASFDKLQELNTVGNHLTSPLQTKRQVNAIVGPLIAGLSKETAGRFTEQDAQMIAPLFPNAGDSEETINTKRAQLNKLISEKMNFPILKTYGIDPASRGGRFGEQGQSRIQESQPVTK